MFRQSADDIALRQHASHAAIAIEDDDRADAPGVQDFRRLRKRRRRLDGLDRVTFGRENGFDRSP
jgi:hypothetical protein